MTGSSCREGVKGNWCYPKGSIWLSHLADIVCWGVGLSHRMRGLVFLPAETEWFWWAVSQMGMALIVQNVLWLDILTWMSFLSLPPAKSWWGIWVLTGWECHCFRSPGLHQLNKHRILAGHRSIICLRGPRLIFVPFKFSLVLRPQVLSLWCPLSSPFFLLNISLR